MIYNSLYPKLLHTNISRVLQQTSSDLGLLPPPNSCLFCCIVHRMLKKGFISRESREDKARRDRKGEQEEREVIPGGPISAFFFFYCFSLLFYSVTSTGFKHLSLKKVFSMVIQLTGCLLYSFCTLMKNHKEEPCLFQLLRTWMQIGFLRCLIIIECIIMTLWVAQSHMLLTSQAAQNENGVQ